MSDHKSLITPNPESRIPNHSPAQLYACLYEPAAGDSPLVAIARDFSPRYEVHRPDLVVVDVAGLDRLLGPPRAIGEELRRSVTARGVRVHVAVAPTQTTAMVLAQTQPGLTVVHAGTEAGMLASTHIGILGKLVSADSASSALSAFSRWGIRTLGELASLPADELVARFGRDALGWQAIARGDDRRPLIPTLDEERFVSALELEWPLEGLEPLSFVFTRLLEPLSVRLERRDRGAAVLHVILRLVTRETYARRLELPSPMRDVRALRTLALLDLESHPPSAAIDTVTIVIDPTPGRVLQHTLFTRAHPTPEQIATLLARLGAVMGQDRIGAPAVVDTDRPGAFALNPFATEHRSSPQPPAPNPQFLTSALRRCRHPVPARVAVADGRPVRVTTDRRGFTGGSVLQCSGPWRTSGAWWASEAAPFRASEGGWDRDEWDVALSDGAVYRVFRDRHTDGWFVDAIVD